MDITVTGLDERTGRAGMRALHAAGAELGVLFTVTPEGRNRYPAGDWIREAVAAVPGRWAFHVCGRFARAKLLNGKFDFLADVQRIQVNGLVADDELYQICQKYPRHVIITQNRSGNSVDIGCENHAVLVDGSGGRGITPAAWIRPSTPRSVGFAGGLGPHNLGQELQSIAKVACEPYWVDMEGRLRNSEDWFSVAVAMRCVEIVQEAAKAGE